MKTPRKASPARSQGPVRTPIRHKHRRTLSVSSARSNASGFLSALVHQKKSDASFVLSPLPSRKSVLTDNTQIEEPRRKSWWKNLGEHSRDVIELLEENKNVEPNNIIEELDMEILSQENKKHITLELPESSDNESINSIVLPQRKLFTQKENHNQKKFAQIVGRRESLAKLHKTAIDKTLVTGTRELFQNKQRSKPIFPAELLNISPNKTTADKTKEFGAAEPKAQVRNIFGNRGSKRKNIFSNFIVSESEDEISEIQPKVFGFQKKVDSRRRSSSRGVREHTPTSSITTDMEMDDWNMLPSSTMVENQLEVMMGGHSPKRARLSKLCEMESENGSNGTKHSNKSTVSKEDKSRKSKTFTKEKVNDIEQEDVREGNNESKSRKSKTFTKEKALETDKAYALSNETAKDVDKSRKSKSFIKEQALEMDVQDDVDNEIAKDIDKSRKSKTFTKEKAESESMATRNRSKSMILDNDEQNKTSVTDKSRKSKTFVKEKGELEISMTTRNKSKLVQNDEALNKSKSQNSDNNSLMKTRRQSKTSAQNESQNTLKVNTSSQTSNQNKTTGSVKKNNIDETPDDQENNDDELNFSLQYENDENEEQEQGANSLNENDANSSKLEKIVEESVEVEISQNSIKTLNKSVARNTSKVDVMKTNLKQAESHDVSMNNEDKVDNAHIDDNVLNKSTGYTNESEQKEYLKNEQKVTKQLEIETVTENEEIEQDQSSPKKASQKNDVSENIQNENEIDETHVSDKIKPDQNASEIYNESKIQEESVEQQNDSEPEDNVSEQELNVSEVEDNESDAEQNESKKEENESEAEQNEDEVQEESEVVENESEIQNESEHEEAVQESEAEQNESEVEEESEAEQNESGLHEEIEADERESEAEQNESVIQNKSEVEEDEHESKAEQNESVIQNESEVEEDEHESEAEQNESHIQNESEVQEESETEQNESQEVESENEEEDQEEEREDVSEAEQESETEQNESSVQHEDQNESENENDNAGSDIENVDNPNISQGNDQQDSAPEVIMGTPNVSHDTTGRNRLKTKPKSPEAVLHNSKNFNDSYYSVKGHKSARKTEMLKSMHRDLVPARERESTGFSDGTDNSSAQGSGWDSHRTTRKTLRQTFGRDFTPRKSLRALVMEKSAKRQTQHNEIASVTAPYPQANSTEMPSTRFDDDDDIENQGPNEISFRTRQTTLEKYLMDVKKKNTEKRNKIEEEVLNSLNAPSKIHIFKVPAKPLFARKVASKPKQVQAKSNARSNQLFGELPTEFIEDLKYKPPKRFQPRDAPWITKHLYKFLEGKLEPKYHYRSRVRAEKLVENVYNFSRDLKRRDVASSDSVDELKREMARLEIVKTHFDFYEFFHQFMPRDVRIKVIPDVINKISLPRHGIFGDIL